MAMRADDELETQHVHDVGVSMHHQHDKNSDTPGADDFTSILFPCYPAASR